MPGIVDLPQVVQEATREFADLFACEPQRRHFGEYLTGLMIAERKSVSGIHREFAETTDQSCWNRFLTEAVWEVAEWNERRLKWLPESPATRDSHQGVIALDDVLLDHDGQFIQDVGWFWDHAEQRNKIAPDDLIAHDVCTSGKHSPLEFRRFKQRDQCEATSETSEDHTVLFCQRVDGVCERNLPGDFTFDSDFSNAENLNHIHSKQDGAGRARGDVGDLKTNRKLEGKGRTLQATELAAEIPFADRPELRRGDKRQWSFTCTVRIPHVNHKVRRVHNRNSPFVSFGLACGRGQGRSRSQQVPGGAGDGDPRGGGGETGRVGAVGTVVG